MRALAAAATGSLETRYRVRKCAGEWTVGGWWCAAGGRS